MPPIDVAGLIAASSDPFDALTRREWLCANGTGSFGSGTVSGASARRYHALLVAALAPPVGRMTLLGKVEEVITVGSARCDLSANRYPNDTVYPDGWKYVASFSVWPVPTWTYRLSGSTTLTKQIFLARGKNTVYVTYRLHGDASQPAKLTVTPLVCWKDYHAQMHPWPDFPTESGPQKVAWHFRATPDAPLLRMRLAGATWTPARWWHENIQHDRERERGQDASEALYCPAVATVALPVGQTVVFTATIEEDEPADAATALAEITARQDALCASSADETERELLLAADQFIVGADAGAKPNVRTTILAGYPWFTDWGRDTMISLPGLLLHTRRFNEARDVLRAFAGYVSEGMIPNRFPDAGETPDYNTVDGTLWFIHACARYVEAASDAAFQTEMTPVLADIIAHHTRGTRYGIRVDPADGLLLAGEHGTNLTWMDAKIGDWVVTPRLGKAVEINALWVHALQTLAAWTGKPVDKRAAQRAAHNFRAAFVRPDGNGLYDVIAPDGTPDATVRPNQVIAAALPGLPLANRTLRAVLDAADGELLTPFGLCSLSLNDPAFRPRYEGDARSRDSAYHQGTVWPWLIGAYIDLCRKVDGAQADVSAFLAPLEAQLNGDYGLGGIPEIIDGDFPHRPNGCPWQAWSVAELLRVRRSS